MMMTTWLNYTSSKGKQTPRHFEGGPPAILECSLGGKAFEQCGLTMTARQFSEEPIKVSSVL
jgi:hypothetical protein